MATSTGSRPLMGMNASTADDPEADADTEGSTDNEKSLFDDNEQSTTSAEKEPLSMKRRIGLVVALLLCVFTIFAFALLLPCHKPKCQKIPGCPGKGDLASVNWTDKFSGITPVMISLVDVTGDGRPDILVEFDIEVKESANSSFLRQLCKSADCRGGGLLAIHGSCGDSLWVFSRNSSLGFLACESATDSTDTNNNKHCLLVEEKTNFVLLNSENGTTKWQSPSNSKVDSFKFVNDVDGDGERDIVFVHERPKNLYSEGDINLISGATGKVLGNSLPLPGGHGSSNILAIHAPSSKQQFVIVGSVSLDKNSTSLWAISVHDLLEKVRQPTKAIPGEAWGKHKPDPLTGFISILKDTLVLIEPLLTDLDGDGIKDVLFVIRENGISLVAVNGNDLAVMWKMVVPLDASIHKLFPTQHSVKEHSTDVGLFVAYANRSSALLVIDGRTGKLSWSFHSAIGFPVAPIPVPGTQQAFVMWLPKLEALTLISKPRKSRQVQQQDSDGTSDDDGRNVGGYANQKARKLLSITSDYAEEKMSRHGHHQEGDTAFPESPAPPERLFHPEFDDNDDDFDDRNDAASDENDDDDDDDIVSKEFQLAFLAEILEKDSDDSHVAQSKLFDKENDKADNKWLDARDKENLPVMHQRGYSEDWIPFTKNQRLPNIVHEERISGAENSDVRADPDMHTADLDEELGHTTNHKKDETLITNHKAKTNRVPISRDHSFLYSNLKVLKELPPEPTREEDEDSDFQMELTGDSHDRQFLMDDDQPADHKQETSKLASAKKPSYHKRSVQSTQSGSQCVKSSGDIADTYTALLLMKDANGKQLVTEITEEGPLYLGPEEYKSLFNVKEGDTKPKSCLRLVPSLISEPVLRDSDEGLDLVYTVSFVSDDRSLHVGKIRKMSMEVVFESLEGKIVTGNGRRHQSKRANDYSFSFPRVL